MPLSPSASDESHDPLVRLDTISVRRDDTTILDRIDLTISCNEIMTLIGPNGAGKTTLARLILGLLRPSSGKIWRQKAIRLGYVPQRLVRPPVLTLTVQDMLNLTHTCPKHKAIDALTAVGVDYVIDKDIYYLSGGEIQRVLLARALLLRPNLLVLDEPMQNVDVTGQIELYELILGLRAHYHCSILLISHDLHIVMAKTDRVVCLNRHICCAGHPQEVTHHPAYTALFGTSHSAIFGLYNHTHHGHHHALHGEVIASSVEENTRSS